MPYRPYSRRENGFLLLEEMKHAKPDIRVIQQLIAEGADLDIQDATGLSSVGLAAAGNSVDILLVLAKAGADLNLTTYDGLSPLNIAANFGYHESMTVLTAAGANPNIADKDGYTPLMWAAFYGFEDNVKGLLDSGADPDALNVYKTNAATMARGSGYKNILQMILNASGGYQKAVKVQKLRDIANAVLAPKKQLITRKHILARRDRHKRPTHR